MQFNDGFYSTRLNLESADYDVIIDQVIDRDDILNELKEVGGYGLMCTGVVISKNDGVSYEDSLRIFESIGLFLTFLNGRRCYPCLIVAETSKTVLWRDFSNLFADRHKDVPSWLPQSDFSNIQFMWLNFQALIKVGDDKICLDYLIHWYLEANNNSAFAEGSIVLLQNAFELLFNWQIIEKKALISKKQ